MKRLSIHTKQHKQVVDITDQVQEILEARRATHGVCYVFVMHTTCSITTADLDPGTDQDLLDALESMFPEGNYRHPHDPSHVWEHIMSSLIGSSVHVPVEDGSLVLGTWQRIVLVELSGSRTRSIVVEFISSGK